MERWIEEEEAAQRASHYPLVPLAEVLDQRGETLALKGNLGDWQAITIKFSGEVLPRERLGAFKGTMYAAYAGDLVFSKIDARNGAVGMIPAQIPKAVVTSEYPVFAPKAARIRSEYLHHLLRADHFMAALKRKASGTSGRKRVTSDAFLSLQIPLPSLEEQDLLLAAYSAGLGESAAAQAEADRIERDAVQAFEEALGVVPPPPLPDRPVFVANFKDIERWSHDGILRQTIEHDSKRPIWPIVALGDAVEDLANGWSPKCHDVPADKEQWGILKVGAVSFGEFDEMQNKALPSRLKPRPDLEVKPGDLLISRANVVRYVGACAYVEKTRPGLMLCDKIFRVKFRKNGKINARYLAEVMRLPSVRLQIESRLTGTSPTMKNISKPALLDLRFPLPPPEEQARLVTAVKMARRTANELRKRAAQKRQSAWSAFELALYESEKRMLAPIEHVGLQPYTSGHVF